MSLPGAPATLRYEWVPQYVWDDRHGWVPHWLWDPRVGWVQYHIWAPVMAAPPIRSHYGKSPHPGPTPYPSLLRTRSYGWWKSLLGLLFAATSWLVVCLLGALVLGLLLALHGSTDLLNQLQDDPLSSPGALLVTNLTLALFIPAVWSAVLVVHQERLGWLSSVCRRIRWQLILVFGLAATVALGVGLLVEYALSASNTESGTDTRTTGFVVGMVLVVLLTTPLQAAGEEFLFRGYLSQVIAGWIPHRVVGPVVAGALTSVLFSLAHGPQDPAAFLSRLAFGITASIVVWRSGGLEASIAFHTMNNVLLFMIDLVTGPDVSVSTSTALFVGLDIASMAAYVGFVWWWTRREQVARTT